MGDYTTKKYFYKPAYKASGETEMGYFHSALDEVDAQMPVFPQAYATGAGTSGDPWAGSCIEDAYAACPTGGTIYLRAGYYLLNGALTISKAINIVGEGMGRTFVVTANAKGFIVSADYVTIRDLTINGNAQDASGYKSCAQTTTNADHVTFKNIEAKNGGYYGINVYETNHSLFENIHAHDNYEMGVHPGSDTEGLNKYNTYQDIYCYNNTHLGFGDRGNGQSALGVWGEITNNIYDNIQAWDNGTIGIQIACQQKIVASNLQAWGNGHNAGINFENIKGATISNCIAQSNGQAGIWLGAVENISMLNCIAYNNDDYGLWIWGGDDLEISNCQFYDDRGSPTQISIALSSSNTNLHLSGCTLSPNSSEITGTTTGIVTMTPKIKSAYTATAGDILYYDGTDWIRLAKGTAGQVLTMNAGATAPEWQTP